MALVISARKRSMVGSGASVAVNLCAINAALEKAVVGATCKTTGERSPRRNQ